MATRRRKKRKTRVTKREVIEIREIKKANRAKARKKALRVPGPWTNIETELKIDAKLRKTSGMMAEILGVSVGNYMDDYIWSTSSEWAEPGWYPIVINVESDDIRNEVLEFGLDEYLAASEKALNNTLGEDGKKCYGTISITGVTVDNSQHEDPSHRFISCRAKTNRKSVIGFLAARGSGQSAEYKLL